jgi:hypothetical protein
MVTVIYMCSACGLASSGPGFYEECLINHPGQVTVPWDGSEVEEAA